MNRRDVTAAWPRGDLATALAEAIRRCDARIVGLSALPGAGKTTVARQIVERLGPHALSISMDDFYLSKAERATRGLQWRGGPGSHDLEALINALEQLRARAAPVTLPRFDASVDDRGEPTTVDTNPDVVLLEGWFLGYPGDGYGAVADTLDLLVFVDLPVEVARKRRFEREAGLRAAGGGFTPGQMQAFWDEVLAPGIDRLVPAATAAADVVIELDDGAQIGRVEASEAVAAALTRHVG